MSTKATVLAARRVVKAMAPEAEEVPYNMAEPRSSRMMWKLYRYAVDGENIAGIGTFPDHVNLFFYRGTGLDDGSGLLQGRGKAMRSITLHSPADAERLEVKRIVKRAFGVAAT